MHKKADSIYKDVIAGIHELIIPSTVLIEVAIVMSRAAGENIAREVYENIKRHASEILYLNEEFSAYCAEKGMKIRLSGFDTVVFSCAVHENSALITNDLSFYRNVKKHHPEVDIYLLRRMDTGSL